MAYGIGNKAIKRLCHEQNPVGWQKAKLSPALFKPYEQPVYEWVTDHLKLHHALPHVETLEAAFPDVEPLEIPEPSSYYVLQLEQQVPVTTGSTKRIWSRSRSSSRTRPLPKRR